MPIHSCEIIFNERLTGDVYRLTFHSETICREAHPGQFVHVRTGSGCDPLLSRPFSIHDVDIHSEEVRVLFQVVGVGTRLLSTRRRGETVDILGPLGRGFRPDPERKRSLLVAGGIGIAPFPFLVRWLSGKNQSVSILAGWRTAGMAVGIEEIESLGGSVEIATEDGSRGYSGRVTDLLEAHLKTRSSDEKRDVALYACGPRAMLITVAHLARHNNVPCQISLEERMACGVGVCHGCAVPGAEGTRSFPQYKLVCSDGPVFDSSEVSLE